MDATQKLIYISLDSLESWESIFNWQKSGVHFLEVGENRIQLLYDGVNHWLLWFNSSGWVLGCENLRTNISRVTNKCLKALCKSVIDNDEKLTITIVRFHTQKNTYNCGLFAVGFAADIFQEISPTKSCFDISRMPENLIKSLEKEKLSAFLKQASAAVNKGDKIFNIWTVYDLKRKESAYCVKETFILFQLSQFFHSLLLTNVFNFQK